MTRTELLEALLVERNLPIPPRPAPTRVSRGEAGPIWVDSPAVMGERMRWLAHLHEPYEPDMEGSNA